MARIADPRHRAALAAAVTVVAWASAFVVIRDAGEEIAPGPLSLIRIGVAGVVLSAVMLVRREHLPHRSDLGWIAVSGACWFGIYNVALNEAERRIDAGTAAMVVYLGPILIALLAGAFLGEGFPRRLLAGCALSFAGVVLIGTATSDGLGDLRAVLLCVLAAALYAVGVVSQKPALARASSIAVTWAGTMVGTAVLLPWGPQLAREIGDASSGAILGALYLAVVPTALAFTTWAYALGRTSAGRLASISYLVPALAVLMGWVFLSERPAGLALVGGAVVIAGVVLARTKSPA